MIAGPWQFISLRRRSFVVIISLNCAMNFYTNCYKQYNSRTIPFETKRPLVDEVRRTWERLAEVQDHGAVEVS